jgi:hypothetical protein
MKLIFDLGRKLYCDVWFWTARNISMAGIPLALIVHITSSLPFTPSTETAEQNTGVTKFVWHIETLLPNPQAFK